MEKKDDVDLPSIDWGRADMLIELADFYGVTIQEIIGNEYMNGSLAFAFERMCELFNINNSL